jgi:hypothetical protein
MRKLISVAGAAMLAVTTFATPASAAGTASGSCGNAAGNYGLLSLYPDLYGNGNTVPALFYEINYSGVESGIIVGALISRDEDTSSYIGQVAERADGTSGSIRSLINSNWANPAAQGGGVGSLRGAGATGNNNSGENRSSDGFGHNSRHSRSQVINGGTNSGYAGGGGVQPGLYTFQVFTGSIQNIVRDPKEGLGPQPTFVADVSNPLGTFSCAVEDDHK